MPSGPRPSEDTVPLICQYTPIFLHWIWCVTQIGTQITVQYSVLNAFPMLAFEGIILPTHREITTKLTIGGWQSIAHWHVADWL